eukprot:scaffold16285_cov55-Phaeocystis_antarctica.AAC.3
MSQAPPQSQDHQVFARHNKFGTFPVPGAFLNTTKKSTADAAAVVTKQKAKVALKKMAKQAAAEQDEAVQKINEKKKAKVKAKVKATIKEEATKAEQAMPAEDAAPAKAAKENAAVQTWPGLNSDSAPWPGWVTVGLCARRFRQPQLPPPPGTNACGADVCGMCVPRFQEESL